MAHIWISKLTIISSDYGFLPGRHQAIIWTNAGVLLITLTPYMVLQLFATRFAAYAGGIRVSFIQPCLF